MLSFFNRKRSSTPLSARKRLRPTLEILEDRALPALLVGPALTDGPTTPPLEGNGGLPIVRELPPPADAVAQTKFHLATLVAEKKLAARDAKFLDDKTGRAYEDLTHGKLVKATRLFNVAADRVEQLDRTSKIASAAVKLLLDDFNIDQKSFIDFAIPKVKSVLFPILDKQEAQRLAGEAGARLNSLDYKVIDWGRFVDSLDTDAATAAAKKIATKLDHLDKAHVLSAAETEAAKAAVQAVMQELLGNPIGSP